MIGTDLRADAARNREAVLAAADAVFVDSGSWDHVSMNAVAAAAGVGKGTVFRAFGDRGGLLRAVMARRSAGLVRAIETGEPPFDADPTDPERAVAVLGALLTFKLANRQLSLALDGVASGSPYQAENYGWWHDLVATSLSGIVDADPRFLAHTLLAAVRSDLLEHLVSVEQLTESQIRAQLAALLTRLLR